MFKLELKQLKPLSFGASILIFSMIPILNFLTAPAAVAGSHDGAGQDREHDRGAAVASGQDRRVRRSAVLPCEHGVR